jgi:hypothetical protein
MEGQHPFATDGAAGVAADDAKTFVVSLGYLDQGGAQAAWSSTTPTVVATVEVGAGEVCVTEDTLRGGIVGDAEITVNLPECLTVTEESDECVKSDAPFYQEWLDWNKPACWCYEKNCRGDVDGIVSGPFRVAIPDLQVFLSAYNKIDTMIPEGGICADFDHVKSGPFRVAIPDLQTLLEYYNDLDATVPACDSTNYNFWETP